MKKIIGYFFLSLFFLCLGILFFFVACFYRSVPKIKGKVSVRGITSEVRIIKDNWGVPHIFAQNEKDLFFACGYIHAQERMWQMDFHRRVGFGRLSEIFGERTLEKDRFIRNLSLKKAVSKEYEKLSPGMKELLIAYADGVNFWMGTRRGNWPPEFLILRYRPEPWKPQDSLIIKEIMAMFLSFEYQYEVVRAELVKKWGSQKALSILEEGLIAPSHEIEDVSFSPLMKIPGSQGSNSWVVAGRRSVSGEALLANDPHLEISLPPIWYEIHLNCPSMNVIGVSIPGSPVIVLGHNPHMAWGMTYSTADCQDLFIEKFDSSNNMYLSPDGWKPLHRVREDIDIRGRKKPVKMEILWTDHGPIISPLIVKSPVPISLCWTIYDGGRTLEAFYLLNKSRNWKEFKESIRMFDAPSNNFVYADRYGNIGYYLSGKIPLRKRESALFPYPGWLEDGQWRGYIAEEEKPTLYNPETGYIATANNNILPEGYPHFVSLDWDAPFRIKRIEELLLQKKKHDVESFQSIQNDVFSKKAELIIPLLKGIQAKGDRVRKALALLRRWDLQVNAQSGAALFRVFMDILHQEVFQDELGKMFDRYDSLYRRKQAGLLRILSDPFSSWFDRIGTDPIETREQIFQASLEKAYQELNRRFGSPDRWDWSRMHRITFRHLLGQSPVLRFFNRGPYRLDGYAFTVKASYSTQNLGAIHGVSYRQIIDLGDFRNSVCVITSGQSGHVLSRFYDNQIPLWLEGNYHPMLFFGEDIEDNASGLLVLMPSQENLEGK